MEKIDFVIIWVDGGDPEWQAEKSKYQSDTENTDTRSIRYRDWDNLQYWFRAVEKYAPWVNKIHFVTCGHLPKWLDAENPKLNIVKHSDYIPEKYLPTFSSHPIELNLHRIEGLSDNFVYFNDDVFLARKVSPCDFFKNGLPVDSAVMYPHISRRENSTHSEAANMDVINWHFNKNSVIKKAPFKWFNLKYGVKLIFNFCLMPFRSFPGILNAHVCTPFKKETFNTVWEKEYELLDEVCSHKFRHALDVNQWLMENWQIVSGNFYPRSMKFGKTCAMSDDDAENKKIYDTLRSKKHKVICINDMVMEDGFPRIRDELRAVFEEIFPQKSSFEK